eukprot:3928156-Amphidinium_carterae.1
MVSGTRAYRVCLMQEASDLQQLMKQTWAGMQDPWSWEFFPETECLRSELCKLSLRPAAVCNELIVLRCRRYPHKLFQLVGACADARDSMADAVLNTPPCLLDRFSKAFLDIYKNVEALTSAESICTLTALAHKAQLTTFSTERLHSRNLRQSRKRVETWRCPLPQLALPHIARCGNTASLTSGTDCKKDNKRGRPRKVHCDEEKPCKKGGGGAWRAFISHKFSGQKMTPNLLHMAGQEYRALSADEKAYFQTVGRAGTTKGKYNPHFKIPCWQQLFT